jgi:hypothetical protein
MRKKFLKHRHQLSGGESNPEPPSLRIKGKVLERRNKESVEGFGHLPGIAD